MASTRYHIRAISLPSGSHPSTLRIEEKLNKFKTWEASSTSRSISNGLSKLEELYKCMDDLLNVASTQEVLSRQQNEKCLDELLDSSVRLLDACSIARDIILMFKEQVQCLQSALRRRKGDSSCESNIANYTCFRKKMKKESKKLNAVLKQTDKLGESPIQDQDHHLSTVIQVLREVNLMTSSIFQSLLLFLSILVSKPKQSKWSLVSKLMHWFQSNIANCTCFGKKTKKDSKNLIAALKQTDKLGASPIQDRDHHLSAVIQVLREVNLMNSSIFQALLLFLSTPVSKPKQSRWSLVSKLMHKGVIGCEENEENVNKLGSVDSALNERSNFQKLQIAPKRPGEFEIGIEDLESCLERVFRPLIKTRASLLNILSQ